MKKTYQYWREQNSGKTGYSVADITYDSDMIIYGDNGIEKKEEYGKTRKTLNAAINDAKRFFKKYPNAFIHVYAHAVLTDFYDDGTQVRKSDEDCATLGTIFPNGEYFDLCEPVDWL